jgi:hypothetical protein
MVWELGGDGWGSRKGARIPEVYQNSIVTCCDICRMFYGLARTNIKNVMSTEWRKFRREALLDFSLG